MDDCSWFITTLRLDTETHTMILGRVQNPNLLGLPAMFYSWPHRTKTNFRHTLYADFGSWISWDLRVLEWIWCDILSLKDSALKGWRVHQFWVVEPEPGCWPLDFSLLRGWFKSPMASNGQPCGFNLQNCFLRKQESIQCFYQIKPQQKKLVLLIILKLLALSINPLFLQTYKHLSFRRTVKPRGENPWTS